MPVITESFTINQTKRFTFRGGFFRLLECSNDLEVSVTVYDSESGAVENLDAIKAGLAITMPFDFIEIRASGGAQTVKFIAASARVEYDREAKQIEKVQAFYSTDNTFSFDVEMYGNPIKCDYYFRGTAKASTSQLKLYNTGSIITIFDEVIPIGTALTERRGTITFNLGAGNLTLSGVNYLVAPLQMNFVFTEIR